MSPSNLFPIKFWKFLAISVGGGCCDLKLCSHQIYSKMLRQFSKGSLVSILSESSKIHILIKLLHRSIWFNLCWFLVPCSECLLVLLPAVQLYTVLVLRSLGMKYFSFANVGMPVLGVTHISNLPTVCVIMKLSSRLIHPVMSKCQICQKSMFITSDIKLVQEF